MLNEYDDTKMLDDMGVLIDSLLNTSDVKRAFISRGSKCWINKVSDEFLREGLKHLSARQIYIIESLLLRDKNILDICFNLGISYESFWRELKDMRSTLIVFL